MTLVRVYLATTEGPTQVQSIVEEDPEVRSVVCRDGTSESLPISNAYDSFVRKPTGVVERHYGHRVFRMDVSSRISEGRSWQLGVFVAHALKAANRLASKDDTPATVLWLTGEVRNDLTVAGVGHVEEKLANSSRLFAELAAAGIEVEAFIPTENGRPDDRVLAALPRTVRLRSVASVGEVCREFALPDPLGGATTAVEIERPSGVVARGKGGGHGPLAMVAAAALALGIPAATLWQGGLWDLWYWEKAGRFRDLGEALILAKDGECRTCALATQVFQLTRHPHGGTEIGVGMVEHRAPAGGSCAQAVSVEIPPIADRGGVLPPSPVENLCALEYRLRFDGKRAALAWLVTAIGEKRERRLKDMRAQPGETVTVRYTLQAAQRTPGTVDVLAVGSSQESDQVTAWLRTLTTPEQFAVAAATLDAAGLSVLHVQHNLIDGKALAAPAPEPAPAPPAPVERPPPPAEPPPVPAAAAEPPAILWPPGTEPGAEMPPSARRLGGWTRELPEAATQRPFGQRPFRDGIRRRDQLQRD